METAYVEWKKDKTIIKQDVYVCPSDGSPMRYIGGAGCSHDDNFEYFYQCEKCKYVHSSNMQKPRYSMSTADFEAGGWKRLTTLLNNK
jgi:hypothetical protein